ncbi:hypothetical protein D3C75_135910 [compost metagenome]
MATVAYQNVWKTLTAIPATSFAGKRYTFVSENAAGEMISTPTGGVPLGITNEPNGPGEPTQVHAEGELFVVLGGTVAIGQGIEVGANGLAVALNTGVRVGTCRVGGAAGDIGTILIK